MRKIFVTGIGTDVGKTVVSSILVEALKADYWKPIQTGAFYSTDSEKLKDFISNENTIIHPEAYSFQQPMSPHAAAEQLGTSVSLSNINLPQTNNSTIIIEGAGGIMVPLNDSEFMVDLIQKLEAETVLVIQNYLGSINHSLLSIDALQRRNVKILGIIFNGAPHQLSEDIVLKYSSLKCLGKISKELELNKRIISRYAQDFKGI